MADTDPDETWTELEELLLACLERPDAERDAALAELCTRHPQHAAALRQRYVRLVELGFVGTTLLPPMQAGERFADYTLIRRLGSGSMGVVYLAEHTVTHAHVALKVLRADLLEQPRARERFRRELVAAAKVDHPGICPVLHAGEHAGRAFLAMRYVAGESLADAIARTIAADPGPRAVALSPADQAPVDAGAERDRIAAVVTLVEQAARALHAAHSQGLVHRDVKPANLLIGPERAPVLVDFGLVRDDAAGDPTLTASTDPLGTPAYMAPEQVEPRGRRPDARTDLYALGAVLFEALTLRRPFDGASRAELYRAILAADPPDARAHSPHVGSDLAVVVQKALEKDPARRYASAAAFADDLRRVLRREPVLARPAGPWRRLTRWGQRHPGLAGALAAAFLSLAAGLIVSLQLLASARGALEAREVGDLAAAAMAILGNDTTAALVRAIDGVGRAPDDPATVGSLYAAAAEWQERERRNVPSPFSLTTPANGSFVAVASDGTAQTWILRSGCDPVELATQAAGHFHVHRVVASADGSRVLVMSVARWNPATKKRRRHTDHPLRLPGGLATLWDPQRPDAPLATLVHPDEVLCGICLADGSVLTGCGDGIARVWPPDSAAARELRGHTKAVYSCAASPDGSLLVTGSLDGTVRRWDARTGEPCGDPIPHGGWVVAVDFIPPRPGQIARFVTATGYDSRRTWRDDPGFADDRVRLFDADGRALGLLGQHRGRIEGVRCSPDGEHVVSFGADYEAQLWRVPASGEPTLVDRLLHPGVVYDAAFDATGQHLATVTVPGTVHLWNREGRSLAVLHGHRACASGCAFLGDTLVTSAIDNTVRTWDFTPRLVAEWRHCQLANAAVSNDERWLIVAEASGIVMVRDRLAMRDSSVRRFDTGVRNITCIDVDATGQRFLLGDESGRLHVFGADGAALRPPIAAHDRQIKQVQWRPGDDGHVLTSSYDGRVRVWNLRGSGPPLAIDLLPAPASTLRAQYVPGMHGNPVWSAAFARDGGSLFAATDDPPENRVQCWVVRDDGAGGLAVGDPTTLGRHSAVLRSMAVARDAPWLAGGSWQGDVWLRTLPSGSGRVIAHLPNDVTAIALQPAGTMVACGLQDGTVHVLRADGTLRYALPTLGARIKSLVFLDEGAKLLVASRSGVVQIWPTDPQRLLAEAARHVGPVIGAGR
ncbi:MAG TPA: protein kinase [Planctomycetota bacterium]|nr:protein kinase [Planctomycetota bacterium]